MQLRLMSPQRLPGTKPAAAASRRENVRDSVKSEWEEGVAAASAALPMVLCKMLRKEEVEEV